MFVKIVRHSVETVYECARYTRRPAPIEEDHEQVIVDIVMEGTSAQNMAVRIDVRDVDMFVMNNEGRTIETFWSKKAA